MSESSVEVKQDMSEVATVSQPELKANWQQRFRNLVTREQAVVSQTSREQGDERTPPYKDFIHRLVADAGVDATLALDPADQHFFEERLAAQLAYKIVTQPDIQNDKRQKELVESYWTPHRSTDPRNSERTNREADLDAAAKTALDVMFNNTGNLGPAFLIRQITEAMEGKPLAGRSPFDYPEGMRKAYGDDLRMQSFKRRFHETPPLPTPSETPAA